MMPSGTLINLLNPNPVDIHIEDIAHCLSNICRFGGAPRRFYSVAEHCVLASIMAEPPHKLETLLHDAAEAYFGDLPTPLKRLPEFAFYRELEDYMMTLIFAKFKVDKLAAFEVKRVDRLMLAREAKTLMPQCDRFGVDRDTVGIDYITWQPDKAKAYYLNWFSKLTKKEDARCK